jgi:DNA-binding Lrp family transcriptional regulator
MTVKRFTLDPIDAAIIYHLQKHPGASLRQIAAGVGLTSTPIRQRILHLEELGLVKYEGGRGKAKAADNLVVHCERIYEAVKF